MTPPPDEYPRLSEPQSVDEDFDEEAAAAHRAYLLSLREDLLREHYEL